MALGVSLPITFDSSDGFTMNYGVKETLRQNFIMLLLTNPGERVMEPSFGGSIDFAELTQDRNSMSMRITYSIPDLGIKDLLELTI